ncbi:MAG: hypothetical protein Fur0041_05770 [Bacteroidia bacterium]
MKRVLPFLLSFFSLYLSAQTGPYWATDVAPILYANCTGCHNPNGIAPFSLMTYNDAANHAAYIQAAVTGRTMPPWPPDTSYTRFSHERVLTQQEIQTIDDWVNNGFPSGNLSQAPTPPTYNGGPAITNPDLVVQMQTYTVNTGADLYRCFVVPSGITQDEFITKVEIVPGNRPVVHHVLVYQDVQNTCVTLDNNDPGPGYTSFGGVGSNTASLIAGWVPGQGVYELPANMGIKLFANSYIIMQIHYPGGTFNQTDSTQVRFTFSSGVVRNVSLSPVINHALSLTNGPLYIPADSVKTFYAQENVQFNSTLISIAPHMHLLGQTITSYAVGPAPNYDTIPLIHIPQWDFHWQGFYTYRQCIHIPSGSVLYAHATYDNTINNPDNPNFPPQDVWQGESTTEEMMVIYYAYLPYQPGDENIIIDSTILTDVQQQQFIDIVKTPQLYDPYPVPSNGEDMTFSYFLPEKGSVLLEITDMSGRTVAVVQNANNGAGFHNVRFASQALSGGNYILKLTAGGKVKTKSFIR